MPSIPARLLILAPMICNTSRLPMCSSLIMQAFILTVASILTSHPKHSLLHPSWTLKQSTPITCPSIQTTIRINSNRNLFTLIRPGKASFPPSCKSSSIRDDTTRNCSNKNKMHKSERFTIICKDNTSYQLTQSTVCLDSGLHHYSISNAPRQSQVEGDKRPMCSEKPF